MQKGIECTFGILKGRWCILNCGVRVHGVNKVDFIWLTCCALHNWLLDIVRLSDKWTGKQIATHPKRDWLGELGDHDFEGISIKRANIPNTILQLSNNCTVCNFDASGMGPGSYVVNKSFEFCNPN